MSIYGTSMVNRTDKAEPLSAKSPVAMSLSTCLRVQMTLNSSYEYALQHMVARSSLEVFLRFGHGERSLDIHDWIQGDFERTKAISDIYPETAK
jgi:hypothetical protein